MNEFLNAVKADLTDRRLLPLVAVVVLALVGAVAYAVLGGSSTSSTPTAVVRGGSTVAPGIAVSQLKAEKAVAETTGGASEQHVGYARNPFVQLPEKVAKSTSTTTTKSATSTKSSSSSSSSSPGSSPSSGSPSTGSSGSGSSPSSKGPTKSTKPKVVYHVAVLFGLLPAGVSAQSAQLTPYEDLKLLAPLPSEKQPLIVYRGVTAGGKSATFTLVSEAILHGEGVCMPSTAQCQTIDLQTGKSEELEYISPSGQTETYELRVVSITQAQASNEVLAGVLRNESKAGHKLLSEAGLIALPGMHYSSQPGVLVFAGHSAFGKSAHAASRKHAGR